MYGYFQMLLADVVWDNLNPGHIAFGAGSDVFRQLAKIFLGIAIAGVVITAMIAIGYYAWGGGRKGEGKDLLMSKLIVVIIIAAGAGILDAVFITATGMW